MIKPEELRIGNYLKNNSTGLIKSVTIETLIEIKQGINLLSNPPKPKYEQIPLTEEWLLNFDIKPLDLNQDNVDIYKNPVGCYNKGKFEYIIEKEYEDCGLAVYITKEIEFIHQLQNIHFIIRDEELTIKD